MPRLSIARSLLLALIGLTLALAVVAALAVASLYSARQDYEDDLARTYAVEVAGANLLTAGVVEEAVRRSRRGGGPARRRAQRALRAATRSAQAAAAGDARSTALVRRAAAGDRAALRDLIARQADRRVAARDRVADRTREALVLAAVAGGAALLAALALVWLLVAGVRRPLDTLVGATRRLARGDLDTRVAPDGPAELRELSGAFNAMAGDLEQAAGRIESERRRLDATIESLGDALVICDGDRRVVQANPRAAVLVPELEPGVAVDDAGPLPALEEVLGREVEIEHRGRTLAVTAARLGGRPEEGVVFTMRDTTERARLEQAKSDFVATASHELRSPLTSIKGFVELLAATELPPRQREFLDIIAISTRRLVGLVDDLLDIARVEAGELRIQPRPTALSEAVGEVATLMGPRFEERRQRLEVELPSALPVAWADPARVRQIVTNLLTNAHLYTPDGGHVRISAGATGDAVQLTVADDGRGMTEAQLERAFERFYRGEGHGTGSGLGLSIVRSLVDLHGGTIDIASAPGQGTTVCVRLPRAPAGGEAGEPRAALPGRTVLVVEDDVETGRLIGEQLRRHGVEVTHVRTGEAAVAELIRRPFDAVTLDILLGGMDGFEVLQRMREDPALRRVPVIVVSVLAGQEALAAAWSVTKPIDADELTDAVGSAILAGRARVLVVGREELRAKVGGMLERHGVEYAWAVTGADAARLCEATHFEVALVDAGMRAPQAALAQLDLRGRRLRRSVVVFSAGDEAPGAARLDPDPIPVEEATRVVVEALRAGTALEAGR